MLVTINNKGNICSWYDTKNTKEYFPKGQTAPLLTLYKDSIYIRPESFQADETGNITLHYPKG